MTLPLEGKVAMITGGSRGIGRATALEFAKSGADIILVSRSVPDLEKAAAEITALGRKAIALEAHVGKLEEVGELVPKALAQFGRIDILVNNAGTSPTMTPVMDVEARLWDSIVNLNLKGAFFLSQAAARAMKEHGGGVIINLASVDGIKPEANQGVYAITKAGIIMMTKVMALEWAKHNIRVNAVAPGNIHTRLRDSGYTVIPGYEEETIKRTPMGHIGQPEEVVGAMVFLASGASSYMTGQMVIVDGGFLLA